MSNARILVSCLSPFILSCIPNTILFSKYTIKSIVGLYLPCLRLLTHFSLTSSYFDYISLLFTTSLPLLLFRNISTDLPKSILSNSEKDHFFFNPNPICTLYFIQFISWSGISCPADYYFVTSKFYSMKVLLSWYIFHQFKCLKFWYSVTTYKHWLLWIINNL